MTRLRFDQVGVLRVRSTSLKRLTLKWEEPLESCHTRGWDIDVFFDPIRCDATGLLEECVIRYFITRVLTFRDMTFSMATLELIYHYLERKPLFKFDDMVRLTATMLLNSSPEMLPVILERCPNPKHLTLELLVHDSLVTKEESRLDNVLPCCLLSSLESVDINSPITRRATELRLVRYFLENSTTLKKLDLHLNQSCGEKHKPEVLKQLLDSPRLSVFCQLAIL